MLTDRKVRTAPAKDKPYRLFDNGGCAGLCLRVAPSGVKSWQLRYKLHGKPQTLTLGKLDTPTVAGLTVEKARAAANEKKKLASAGTQLTAVKHAEKARKRNEASNTFGVIAALWLERESKRQQWVEPYRAQVESRLKNHLKGIADKPITEIDAPTVAPLLLKIEHGAPTTRRKVEQHLHSVLNFAVRKGVLSSNKLPPPERTPKGVDAPEHPAVTDLAGLGAILRAARAAAASEGVKRAHELLAYTAQRINEVVGAEWSEFDFAEKTWTIPRSRMKMKGKKRGPHTIPLPPHLLTLLREWRKADPSDAVYVARALTDPTKPIGAESVQEFYRDTLKLRGKHVPHSWRSAFSTVCREAGKDSDSIEAQLDHQVGSKVASAYDRSQRLELRRHLLAWYEATLVAARDGAQVLPITKRRKQ